MNDLRDRTLLPEQLRDVVGYKFWTEDSQSKVRRTIIGLPQRFADEQFFRMLDILVQEMASVLGRVTSSPPEHGTRGGQQAGVTPAPQLGLQPETTTGPAVFLAGSVTALDEERIRVITYFRQAGLRVMTPETLPFEREAYLKALHAACAHFRRKKRTSFSDAKGKRTTCFGGFRRPTSSRLLGRRAAANHP